MIRYNIRHQFPYSQFRPSNHVEQWYVCQARLNTRKKSSHAKLGVKPLLQQRIQKLFAELCDKLPIEQCLAIGNELFVKRFLTAAEKITHMDEVRRAQENVRRVKETLIEKNKEKHTLASKLDCVRSGLSQIYRDMKTNDRSQEKYLDLTRQEIELYMNEKDLLATITKVDEEERRLLYYELTAAINESFEKEKVHAHTIKVFGLVGAILSAFLTYIYQQKRFHILRQEVEKSLTHSVKEKVQMIDVYMNEVLRVGVAQICQYIGYDAAKTVALEVLQDIVDRFLKALTRDLRHSVEHCNRTEANLNDMALTLSNCYVNLDELTEYVTNVEPTPFAFEVPKFPRRKASSVDSKKPSNKEVSSGPIYLNQHLLEKLLQNCEKPLINPLAL
uniref:Bromodomain associated domain-containing protein n=1 Tax=Glossina austeni TaxID=7395 RepID=A0A1A9UL11_GLOAU